ncbi:MAG TPA: hypothetical protein EYP33_00635, partial [Pyrodictium sp.]|nr:hypothetical protein [Pyrodictium sp.]
MNVGSVHDPVLFDFWSVEPSALYTREYGYTEYQGYIILALPAIGLAASIAYARFKGLRGATLPIAVSISALAALALSMGKYTPLAALYTELPYFDKLPPIRFLSVFNLLAVTSFAIAMQYITEASRRTNMAYMLVVIVAAIAILDAFPQSSFLKIELPDHGYVEAMAYLRDVDKVFRVYQPGLLPLGSLLSFGPVFSAKDILEGWYREANPTLNQLIVLNSATASGCKTGCEKAKALVKKLCLMYALSDKRHPAFTSIDRGLRRLGYSKVAEFGYIEIYRLNNNCSYVNVAGPRILAVGTYAKNIPSLVPEALVDTYDGYLDDLSSEDLAQYDIVVLYGFRYRSRATAAALVEQYLTNGGVIVIDTWGSPELGSQDVLGLGVSSKTVSLKGVLRFTVTGTNIVRSIRGWSTGYSYGDGNWTA